MPGDIFEEYPFWGTFQDDPGDHWPEMARVIGSAALSGGTEGLAGISGEDDVEGAAERPGIETEQIIPDWGWGEIPGALGSDEDCAGVCLPLDEGPGVISGFGKHDAQIEASAACAEG